jgi:hypothetical protein
MDWRGTLGLRQDVIYPQQQFLADAMVRSRHVRRGRGAAGRVLLLVAASTRLLIGEPCPLRAGRDGKLVWR